MHFGAGHADPISRALFNIFSWQGLILFACTIILCLIWQLVVFAKERKAGSRKRTTKYYLAILLFLFYLMLVYRLTGMTGLIWWIRSPLIMTDRIMLIPFASSNDIVPFLYNVLMTIPFGFLLPAIWSEFRSIKKVALAGFILSLTIETLQLFTLRLTAVDDLMMNTLGAVIGYLIFKALYRLFRKKQTKEETHNTRTGMRYEAIIFVALSLMGAVFLFHPAIEHIGAEPVTFIEYRERFYDHSTEIDPDIELSSPFEDDAHVLVDELVA